MKILATLNAFYSFQGAALTGGDKRFVERFKRLALRGKFEIDLMTVKSGAEIVRREGLTGIPVVMIPSRLAQSALGILIDYLWRTLWASLQAWRLRSRYDLVYSAVDILTDIVPAFLMVKFGRPRPKWVVNCFIIQPPTKNNGAGGSNRLLFWQQSICHRLMKSADLILADNTETKQTLIAKGFNAQQIRVVPAGGIDLDMITSTPASSQQFEGLFVGRLYPGKGIFELPAIWAEVCKALPGQRLGVVGAGREDIRRQLSQQIADLNLTDQISLLGPKTPEEVCSLLKSAKIFLFPSYYESWAIAVCEALACGVPVVAYDLPLYSEIYGSVIQRAALKDNLTMAKHVIKILTDDTLRQALQAASLEVGRRYTWDDSANLEEALLLSLLAK